MCCFSSRSSLLDGVFAVVLAASVGSGAFAQTVVEYRYHSPYPDRWADGTERAENDTTGTDIAEARDGDHLTLNDGFVRLDGSSRSKRIGILRSGKSGTGRLTVRNSGSGDLTGRIGEIRKQDSQAVDLFVQNLGGEKSLSELIVTGDAVVNDLGIFMEFASTGGSKGKATFGGDLTIEGGATLKDAGANNRAYLVFNGSADQRILGTGTAKITAVEDGEGTIQVLNGRDGRAPHKATFDIEIGANDKRLRQLTVGDTSNGGHAIFNRGVHVDNIDVIGGNHTNERTTVEFRGDVSGETIALKDGFHRTSPSAGTVVNARAIFNASAGDITVGNKITGGRSDGGSRGGGLTIIGGRSGDPARRNTVTFNGEIGAGRDRIGRIFVGNNESAGVAVFKKDINAGSIEIRGGATADAASHVTIEQSTAYESGFITIGNNATLTIGGVGRLATVNDGGQTIRGFISAGSDGQGTLIVDNRVDGTTNVNNNKVTFTQRVGYDGTALRKITLKDGFTVFNGGVYADTITITTGDTTVFRGHVGADTGIQFGRGSRGSFIYFGGWDGQTITGNITSAAGGNYGTITIANMAGVTFTGALGASGHGLDSLTLNDGSIVTFAGNVYLANGLKLGNGTITFGGSGNQTIQADIRNSTGKRGSVVVDNSGTTHKTVTFEDAVGVSGAGKDLAQIKVRDGVAVFKGDVFAQYVEVGSTDGAEFKGDVTTGRILFVGNDDATITLNGTANQTVTGDIITDSDGRGLLVVHNTGRANNNTVTFTGRIGSTRKLRIVSVGEGGFGFAGSAVFREDVNSRVFRVAGSDAGGSSQATVEKDLTAGVTLTDNGGSATLTIGGAGRFATADDAGQTINGRIEAGSDGQGTLIVDNRGEKAPEPDAGYTCDLSMSRSECDRKRPPEPAGIRAGDAGRPGHNTVTFSHSVGSGNAALRQITLKDGRTTFHKGVYADTITITTGGTTVFKGDVKADRGVKLGRNSNSVTFDATANQRISGAAKITTAADGEGKIQVLNGRDDRAPYKATFDIGIGTTDKRLRQLTVGDLSRGGGAIFNRGVHVDHIDVIGGNDLRERTIVEFRGDVSGDTIRLSSPFASGRNGADVVFNASTGDITVDNEIFDGRGGSGRTVIIGGRSGHRQHKVTLNGKIGSGDDPFTLIYVGRNGAAGEAIFKEDVVSYVFEVNGGHAANEQSRATVEKNLTTTDQRFGTVQLSDYSGSATLTIGGAGRSATVNDAGQTINFWVRAGGDGQGTLIVDNRGNGTTNPNNNTVTFTQSVGAYRTALRHITTALRQITLSDGRTTFQKGVYADTITIDTSDATVFRGDVKADTGIQLGDGSSVTFKSRWWAGQTITGNITSAAGGNYGTITIANTHADGVSFKAKPIVFAMFGIANPHVYGVSFTGSLGASGDQNGLSRVTLNNNAKAAFAGNVYLENGLTFANGSQVTFNGTTSQTVAGDLTSAAGGNYGTMTIANSHADGVTFTGSLGASGANNGLSRVTLNTNAKAAFAGNVYLGNGLTFANGSQVTFNGTTSQTVAGDLTSAAGGNYGTMTIANDVSFTGSLGTNSAKLANLTLTGHATAATASRASFAGNVYLNGNLTLGENTRVTLNGSGDQEISATITNGDTAGRGDIVVNNSGGTVTFANAVGGSGGALKQITLDDGQTVFEGAVYAGTITVNSADGTTFNGAISATTFKFGASATANSRVTFGGSTAQTITPAITTDSANSGAITIANRAGVTFEDDLGTDAARLASLTLDTGTKATLEQSGYLAGNVTIGNGATLIVGDASGVTGGRGTTAADAQTITGNIVAGDDGQGNLEIRNRSRHATGRKVSFTGSIGADGRALNRITVADGETIFGGDVYAGNLTITARDATTFRGHVKADREFELGNGSSVTFGGTAGQRITGNITSASGGNYGAIIIANTHADGVTFGGQLGASGHGLRSLTVNEGAKVTFTRPVYLSGTLRLKTGTTLVLGDYLTRRDDATRPFVTVGDYAFEGDFTEANRVRLILPLSFTSGTQKVFSAHDTLDKEKFSFAGNNLVNYSYDFDDDGTDVTVKDKGSGARDEGNQGDGSGDTDVKVADKDADKDADAGDEGNQGDGSGDTDVKVADKDADKDAGDEGNQGDGSGDTDVKVADKDADKDAGDEGNQGDGSGDTDVKVADKDAGDEGNQGDGSGDTDVKVADKDADKDAGDEGNQGDGSGDTDVKVADKDAGDEGNQGDGSGDTDVKVADKDADKDAGDEGNQGDGSGDTDVIRLLIRTLIRMPVMRAIRATGLVTPM